MTAQPFDREAAERALQRGFNPQEGFQIIRAAIARIDEQAEGLADRDARLKEIAGIAREAYVWNQSGQAAMAAIRALASGEKPNG